MEIDYVPDILHVFDPGANGGYVRMHVAARHVQIRSIKKDGYRTILNLCQQPYGIRDYRNFGAIEDLAMRAGDLKKSHAISVMLKHAGRALLCMELNDIPYIEVPPKNWQYPYGLVGYKYDERKKLAVLIASEIFGIKATLADADALLLADYMWHQVTGTPYPERQREVITKLTITKEVNRG